MDTFEDILGGIHGGKVLDVATGVGGFVHTLKDCLASYEEILGIDNSEKAALEFPKAFSDERIRFRSMDAHQLDFPAASFDTVTISYSLHHVLDLAAVLREMLRVLKPGGYLIVAEMYQDGQTETQMSHVLLHHWWGAVDRLRGLNHQETFTRAEILQLVSGLELESQAVYDLNDLSENPHDPETLNHLENTIDQYLLHLEKLQDTGELKQQGEALRQRLRAVGFDGASVAVLVGRKAGL